MGYAARRLVEGVELLLAERTAHPLEHPWRSASLEEEASGFSATVDLASEPHVAFYVFRFRLADGETAFYVPRADGRSTAGQLVRPDIDGGWHEEGWSFSTDLLAERPMGGLGLGSPLPGFQLSVYEPAFATPDWLAGSIMYQVFPDRFARGSSGVRIEGVERHRAMGRPVRLHESWSEPVEWTGAVHEGEVSGDADPEERIREAMAAYDPVDFYGGTLEGIREKLGYLHSLGVEVLYLNPVFEARSNHRYDTADYEHVDPLLGSDEDFTQLAEEAAGYGISIVLDAVLSHTGNDSRYFNAFGTYDEPGAAQGAHSPFYGWYDFSCENEVGYRCWWGDRTLPEVNEHDAAWQAYVLGDYPNGILARWIAAGARGYRLDVADEIPDDVLERLRTCVKRAREDGAIIGEVWEDATTKTSYGQHRTFALGRSLDSVMNYPLRSALLAFALGVVDAYQLAAFLKNQQAYYPPQLYRCLMNLLSSHDVERMRSVLALGGEIKHLPRNEQVLLVDSIEADQDERAARLQRMLAALLYVLPGVPCLYYGDEKGLQGGGDPFCRATFPEDGVVDRSDRGVDLTDFYREIGALRKQSSALREGPLACTALDSDLLAVVRADVSQDAEGLVLAFVNSSAEWKHVVCDLRSNWMTAVAARVGDVPDQSASAVFCSEAHLEAVDATISNGLARVAVPPLATVVYRCQICSL